ncbi:WD40/YVTN/BNR-like repeat-containing protein [Spirosoma fluviale]|uniref:BNR/Asp-box repeat-containing protein n=1 Tax=Spirosoma fluviale TaxID=1597977 RepID=A0A286GCB5_9BACT|nr:glycosyl hydrolase [Spirosoma fluviale]SOD93173.1 BNR/Asp-box repeat-containing protein [Spirosoma fluviale]
MKIVSLAFLLLFQIPFVCNEAVKLLASSPITDRPQKLTSHKSGLVNLVFKSTDGGQTWQDISKGLPEGSQGDGFFATTKGLYLQAGNGLYHSNPNSTAPFWEKESFPDQHSSIAPGKTGIVAYNYYDGQFLQKINGTSVWSPMYTNVQERQVRTVFETVGGTVFIGSDKGLLKSTDSGKTWKRVHSGGWVIKMVESNGVLMATSQKGIIRSTDDGENWDCVLSEGGVGIAVERIKGGFAAITYNTQSETRRVRTSYDDGKSWQPIDADLPASLSIASIIEVGGYFFCGHPTGIFRSSDKGKTWKLLLPSIDDKVFNLAVSGNVIYAIPRAGGC